MTETIVTNFDDPADRAKKKMTRAYHHHGMTKTREYQTWRNIKERCGNPLVPGYRDYGGRGIQICEEWRLSFQAFYNHVGPHPGKGYSIDRINNNGNYEPGNVRWATRLEQEHNKRTNVHIAHNGETHCINEWARRVGIHPNTLHRRLRVVRVPVEKTLIPHSMPIGRPKRDSQ